ncbi:hypothetical protein [Desulfospira joergensenii]|uniref:hypothetical protein n=1 Tax=Desulfospira joergensenii TaxID=53329 RepID=UPI0003B71595|nr:hypothetical protein [Desulfospira joergensenii]
MDSNADVLFLKEDNGVSKAGWYLVDDTEFDGPYKTKDQALAVFEDENLSL